MKKSILVTGGSSGIGLRAVRRLAARGHQVFSASRNPTRNELPEGATPIVCDVGAPDCAMAIDEVVARTGRLDALVNNAGTGAIAPLEEGTDDEARRIFEVNLLGPMRLARASIPIMRAQGGGRIVNVTSLNDVLCPPFLMWYAATKAGLAAASYSLAAEIAQFGIKVTVVAPGRFRTDMSDAVATAEPPAGSLYRAGLAFLVNNNDDRSAAGDPDEVGAVIEECIEGDNPPIRIAVGADAGGIIEMASDPNDYVAMLAQTITDASKT